MEKIVARIAGSEIVKIQNGMGPIFGAGSNEPSHEKNWQKIEWKLASGERILLETSVFQLDGQNPYAMPGGPQMPLYRTVELKKKSLFGWSVFFKKNQYEGCFDFLNILIRATDEFRTKRDESLLIVRHSYKHARFGHHEYFDVADKAESLSDFVLSCASFEELQRRMAQAIDEPELKGILSKRLGELQREIQQLRAEVKR